MSVASLRRKLIAAPYIYIALLGFLCRGWFGYSAVLLVAGAAYVMALHWTPFLKRRLWFVFIASVALGCSGYAILESFGDGYEFVLFSVSSAALVGIFLVHIILNADR